MADNDDVTIGEVFRRLCDMDERYEKKLDQIDQQVRLTNGRTTKLEERVEGIMRRFRSGAGESFAVTISPKIWAAIAAGGGMLFAMLVDWLKNRAAS